MKLALTLIGIASRLARLRAERARDRAIGKSLATLAERARQRRADADKPQPENPDTTKTPRS